MADGTGEKSREAVVAVASNDDVGRGMFGRCIGEFIGRLAVTDLERPADICGVEDLCAVAPTDLGKGVFGRDHRACPQSHCGAGYGDRWDVLHVHHRDRSVGGMCEFDGREESRVGTDGPVVADHDRAIGHRCHRSVVRSARSPQLSASAVSGTLT